MTSRRQQARALALVPVVMLLSMAAGGVMIAILGRGLRWGSPLLVMGAGFATVAVVAWFAMLPVGQRGWPASRNPTASGVMFLTLILCAALGIYAHVQPLPRPAHALSVPPTGWWDLPSGSRIAYYRAAVPEVSAEPVIVLHDGPGQADGQIGAEIAKLSSLGREVYAYDRVGVGRSSRLADVTGYTVARDVADLDEVRTAIGAEKAVLLGTGWGAALAAQYAAMHPGRVSALILSSPAPMIHQQLSVPDATRQLTGQPAKDFAKVRGNPRAELARLMALLAPRMAPRVVPDAELDEWASAVQAAVQPAGRCPHQQAQPEPVAAGGGYALIAGERGSDAGGVPDPAPALRGGGVPTLIVRGACDYVPWEAARAYRDTIPGAQLISLPDHGHALRSTAATAEAALIRAFLAQEQMPMQAYSGAADPGGR